MHFLQAVTVLLHLALLPSLPFGAQAPFVPCEGISLSGADVSFLVWLEQLGLTEWICKGSGRFQGAVEPILGPPCQQAPTDGWSGNGTRRSINEVKLKFYRRIPTQLHDSLAALPCLEAIDITAGLLATFDVLIRKAMKSLPVKEMYIDFTGTLLDAREECWVFRHSGYGQWGFQTRRDLCAGTFWRISLPESLLSFTMVGSTRPGRYQDGMPSRVLGSLSNLPRSLQKLTIRNVKVGGRLPSLPNTLRELQILNANFNGKLDIPNGMETFHLLSTAIEGKLPPELPKSLRVLTIWNVPIKGRLPEKLPDSMQGLHIAFAKIKGKLPQKLPKSLRDLIIWGTLIEGKLPQKLPKSLRNLIIRGTLIEGKLPQILSKSIRHLELQENLFEGEVPHQWAEALDLEVFRVDEKYLRSHTDGSDVLDDINVWPKLKELSVQYGSPGKRWGREFIRSVPDDFPLLCRDWLCDKNADCSSGQRYLECIKAGKVDGRLTALGLGNDSNPNVDLNLTWALPNESPFLDDDEEFVSNAPQEECRKEADPKGYTKLARIYAVETGAFPEDKRFTQEFVDALDALPCLQRLEMSLCGRWPNTIAALGNLRNLTIAISEGRECLNTTLTLPANLTSLETKGVAFAPRTNEQRASLDGAHLSLPENLPSSLQHIHVKLDPTLEWILPTSLVGMHELKTLTIEGNASHVHPRLRLTPVFGGMQRLEEVTVCSLIPLPVVTRIQLCDLDANLWWCGQKLSCVDYGFATAMLWALFGGALVLCLCRWRLCTGDSRFLLVVSVTAFLGAVGANVWLIVATWSSKFSGAMLGIAALNCIVAVLGFADATRSKRVFSLAGTAGSGRGIFDNAWFLWRFKGRHGVRYMKTVLLALTAPLVLGLAAVLHAITGKQVVALTREVNLGEYLRKVMVFQGVIAPMVQAVFQTIVFNLSRAKFYDVVADLDVTVGVFATTLALALASIVAAALLVHRLRVDSLTAGAEISSTPP